VPCIQTRLCAVSLRPPVRDIGTATLAEYYARRLSSPYPLGFPSLACYEEAVADGKLVLAYAKDVDLQEEKPKKRASRKKESKVLCPALLNQLVVAQWVLREGGGGGVRGLDGWLAVRRTSTLLTWTRASGRSGRCSVSCPRSWPSHSAASPLRITTSRQARSTHLLHLTFDANADVCWWGGKGVPCDRQVRLRTISSSCILRL